MPREQLSVNTEVTGCLSRSMERPLNEAMKLCHHKISALMLLLSIILCEPSLSKLIVSIMRREITLPPYITPAQKLSFQAKDCNCFFDARLWFRKKRQLLANCMSFSSGNRRHIAMESISVPRNIIFVKDQQPPSKIYGSLVS